MTDEINLKCSSCDRPILMDHSVSSEPGAIVCCQGCGKEFGTALEIRDAAAILSEAESVTEVEDLLADLPFLGNRS